MAWLFLIVVCGIAALFSLDFYFLKLARKKYILMLPIKIRRHFFKSYAKGLRTCSEECIKRFWSWCRFLWENPAILLLVIAGVLIFGALIVLGADIYKLYVELSGQIKKAGNTDEIYRGIAIRYFGIIAAVGAVIGYIIAISRNITANNQNKSAEEQNRINERARITESMVQAIAQIGTFNDKQPNIEVRLGGIYSLERIAKNSDDEYKKIMDILCAYVRVTASKKQKPQRETEDTREDTQAAIDVLGTKKSNLFLFEKRNQFRVNLEDCNLSGYRFSELDFNTYSMSGGAIFDNSLFKSAEFHRADLSYGSFDEADLTEANFEHAKLVGARFLGATFKDTKVHGADFSNAEELTPEQVKEMIGDKNTKLPRDMVLSKIEESPN